MQQAGGNEAFSGLLEPWGRGSVWGGLVSVPGGSCCSRGVGLARILQLPPILHPAAFGSRSRPAPGTAAVPGELSFLGQLRAAGSSQLPLPALLGTVGGGFPAVRGDVAPPPGGCGRGELSPRSPSAHPDGRWGSLLPWQEHCQAPPVKLIAPGVSGQLCWVAPACAAPGSGLSLWNARLPGQVWCCWRQRRCLYLPPFGSARGGRVGELSRLVSPP